MTGTTLRLIDGTTEVRLALAGTNYDSPYRCKSYDLGYPEPRAVSADSAGVSGVTDLTTLHGSRTVSLSLTVWNDGAGKRHQYLDVLRGMCRPWGRPWLYAQCEGWPQERRAQLRGSPLACVVGQPHSSFVEVSLSFEVPAGLFESVVPVVSSPLYPVVGTGFTLTPGGTLGGGSGDSPALTIPAGDAGSAALTIEAGSGNNIAAIVNAGNALATPTFIINGPCTSPSIYNRTDQVQITFGNFSVPAGHFALVDVASRQVLLDGDPAQNIYSRVDWSVSRWFALNPGPTTLEFTTAGDGTGASLIVQHTPRFF